MKIPLPKLKALILYLCENTNPRFLGTTKLMKLLYFIDFDNVKQHGFPITYDRYVNLEHGPVPSTIMNMVDLVACNPDDAELSDTIKIEPIQWEGRFMKLIKPTRKLEESEIDYFSDTELDTLAKICKRFGRDNTKKIERASHNEAAWSSTDLTDDIPYSLAGKDGDSRFTEEEISEMMKILT